MKWPCPSLYLDNPLLVPNQKSPALILVDLERLDRADLIAEDLPGVSKPAVFKVTPLHRALRPTNAPRDLLREWHKVAKLSFVFSRE